jgi:hypothetical protein
MSPTIYAISVSAAGLLALQRQYAQVQVHVPGQLAALQHALNSGAWLTCPSALAPAVEPQLVETAPGLFVPAQ